MIPYIDRDLIRSFFLTFIVMICFVQVGVFVYTLLDQYESALSSEESKLGWILLYFLFTLPRQIVFTFPVATAVSVLWTFMVKARQNELLAYFVGGVSPLRVAAPMLILSGFLAASSYVMTEFLATKGDRAAERIERLHIQERRLDSVTKQRNVFQKGQGSRFYNVVAFNPSERTLEHPIVIQMNDQWTGPRWRMDATRAEGAENPDSNESTWVFYDVYFRSFDDAGNVVVFEHYDEMRGDDEKLTPPIEAELDRYITQRFRPEQMNLPELLEYIQLFKLQNRRDYRLETVLHQNFAVPLGCIVLTLVMCGHILRPRATGVVVGFGGGLLLMAFYFGAMIFGRRFSLEGVISPIIGSYAPNVLFLFVGLFLRFTLSGRETPPECSSARR
jgi:lipopolysaccharide export system permease protein